MINILIRTSNRPKLFQRCLNSVIEQNYNDLRIIVSYDKKLALNYIPEGIETIRVKPEPQYKFFYDLYCNDLKSLVTEGHFMFLDDDDYLLPNVLHSLPLENEAIICQYKRKNNIFPLKKEFILSGKIGMPCLILHSKHKNIADIPGDGCGDFHWIKSVTDKIDSYWFPKVISQGDFRGYGKPIYK